MEAEVILKSEIEVFQKIGYVEIPVRGIVTYPDDWEIADLETGETLDSIPMKKRREILFVLDGDHVLTKDFHVFSFPQKKDIQELKEMKKLFGGYLPESRSFSSFPVNQNYVYTSGGDPHSVFDPNISVEKLVIHVGNKIEIWGWNSKGQGATPVLSKDYELSFEGIIWKIIPLPARSRIEESFEVGIVFLDSFTIFDIQKRVALR